MDRYHSIVWPMIENYSSVLETNVPICGFLTDCGEGFAISACSFWKVLLHSCHCETKLPNICKDIFPNISLQIFWPPPPLSHASLCFLSECERIFVHRWCKGRRGLGLAARQLKCPGNIHQIPTNILPDGWCVFGQLNMYNWGVKNAPEQSTEH